MLVYDEKNCHSFGDWYVLSDDADITQDFCLKTSCLIPRDIDGGDISIIANHDLFVIGNIKVKRLEVKENLFCIGNCTVDELIVTGEIICNAELDCTDIFCSESIIAKSVYAESIDVGSDLIAQQSIRSVKSLSTKNHLLCGEGLSGTGIISSKKILFGDFNNFSGEIKAEVAKDELTPTTSAPSALPAFDYEENFANICKTIQQVAADKKGWEQIGEILDTNSYDSFFDKQLALFTTANRIINAKTYNIVDYIDIVVFLAEADKALKEHAYIKDQLLPIKSIIEMALGKNVNITSVRLESPFRSFDELLTYINKLEKHKNDIPPVIFEKAAESFYSHISLKPQFIDKVLKNKGWK